MLFDPFLRRCFYKLPRSLLDDHNISATNDMESRRHITWRIERATNWIQYPESRDSNAKLTRRRCRTIIRCSGVCRSQRWMWWNTIYDKRWVCVGPFQLIVRSRPQRTESWSRTHTSEEIIAAKAAPWLIPKISKDVAQEKAFYLPEAEYSLRTKGSRFFYYWVRFS